MDIITEHNLTLAAMLDCETASLVAALPGIDIGSHDSAMALIALSKLADAKATGLGIAHALHTAALVLFTLAN